MPILPNYNAIRRTGLAASKDRAYYKAVRRATAAINSDAGLKPALDSIVRGTARAMKVGVSLVLLDSTKTKRIHSSSGGLHQAYIQKGVLEADKSLTEVLMGQPVAIADVSRDSRVQYPELATKTGIVSILGVPLMVGGVPVGSIRVYTKEYNEFSKQDVNFVTTMATLAAMAIHSCALRQEIDTSQAEAEVAALRQVRAVTFAHPSEEEFAHILDFYNMEWVYEPRSFPLRWEGDKITEMFTPDFYLSRLDLYVELTTLKQSLVTEKNRKLRRLRELYPEIKITLLYKKDFDRLLAKYGCGPLAQARGRGIGRVLYSSAKIHQRVRELAEQLSKDYADCHPLMVGVLRGVLCFMADLVRQMSIPLDIEFVAISRYSGEDNSAVKITKDMDVNIAGRHVIMVEDIVDTGMTLNYMLNYLKTRKPASLVVCSLLDKRARRIADVPLDYIGFTVPDKFVVGYGLDYREEYRNLPFISVLESEEAAWPEGSSKSEDSSS